MSKVPTIKQIDKLWAEVVKARACYKSEYPNSKQKGYLNAHHICGKGNQRLRWELDNGVSITQGEHKYIAHHSARSQKFRTWAMELRGFTENKLSILERYIGGVDKFAVYLYLIRELKKYKAGDKDHDKG